MEKHDGGDPYPDWHEDPDWWASKGIKGLIDEKTAKARKMFKKLYGKDKSSLPRIDALGTPSGGITAQGGAGGSSGGGGGGGFGGVGTVGGNGVSITSIGGPGAVYSSQGQGNTTLGAVSPPNITIDKGGLDDKARVEILSVKQALQQQLASQHIPPKSVIAGGVFVSLFNGEPIQDIDVFILGAEENQLITLPDMAKPGKYTTNKDFANYTGRDDIIAIFNDTESKVQYIYTKVETPRELLEAFDFVHCCCAYYDDKLWINARMYDAIKNKWLIPNIERDKVKPERKAKFLNRGFIEPGDLTNFYAKP